MPDTIDFTEEAAPQIDFLADEDVAKIGIEEPQRAINQSLRTMQLGALAAPEPPPPTPPLNRVVGKYGLEPSPGSQTLIGPQLSRLAQAIPPGQGPVTRPLSSLGRTALGFGAAALEPQNLLATSFAISPPGALAVGGYFGYQGVKGALDSVRNIVKLMQAPGPVDEAFKQKLSDELVNALSMAVAAGEISAAEARGIRQMVTKPPVQGPLATGAILPPRRGALPMAGPERLGPPVPPARVRTLQEAEANLPGGAPPLVTAAEAGRDESVIEEIRRRNLNTNEKILNAFPELRTRPSPNQQAARLRRASAERQGPPLPPGAAPQAPRPVGVRTGDLQGPDQVVAGTRPVVQPMRVENQPVFQGPQIPEVVQAQREREAGMQRELEARRSALQQNIVFWERELEMARNRGDRRAQDNAAKQLLLFRGEYEGIPPVKEIVPKPPIPRAPGSAFRPEVPGTPGQEQESVLAEIRRKNLRTRQQVINNFPGFREGGRSGERAAELLRQAWPQIQGPPLPPEEPPAQPPGAPVPKPPGAPPTAPATEETPQTAPGAPAPTPEPVPPAAPEEAAPSPTPATPAPAPEAPVTPEETTAEPTPPTVPATIEDTPLAGKTLGEWEAIKDASQLPRGTARAELAKWLAVPNQPSRILQALGNKRRTREIHAPPMEVTPVQPPPGPTKVAQPESSGGGWVSSGDWRKSFDQAPDIEEKIDWLRAVANNRGHKATAAELSDALDRAETLFAQQKHSRIANTFWDISRNPGASDATKAKAQSLYDQFHTLPAEAPTEEPPATTAPETSPSPPSAPASHPIDTMLEREFGIKRKGTLSEDGKTYTTPPITRKQYEDLFRRVEDANLAWTISGFDKAGNKVVGEFIRKKTPAERRITELEGNIGFIELAIESDPSQREAGLRSIEQKRQEIEQLKKTGGRKVAAAAVRLGSEQATGRTHIEASTSLRERLGIGDDDPRLAQIEEGFVDDQGKWVDPNEAFELGRAAGQVAEEGEEGLGLHSGDLIDETLPPTTSVEAPSQTPSTETPVQQKKPFDTKQAKQQKTFLLTEVDKAIAQAPDVKEKWQNLGLATDYNLATGTATPEQLEALFAKYDIPTQIAPSTVYTDIEGKPSQAEKGSTLTRAARIERLKLAIEKVNFDSAPKVTIDVPGDGTFSIVDSKSALEAFKERAKKFPTAAPKTSTPSKGRITPTAVAALGTLNADSAKRAAGLFASTDLGRNVINYAYSDGRTTVATDGRRLIVVNAPIGGTPKKPALVRLNDKAKPLGKDDKFPNYNQVIPSEASQTTIFQGLDASRLFNIVQQAKQALGDKINSVTLYRNTDGSLGMTSGEPAIGEYSHNLKHGAKIVTTLNADYLADIFSAARMVGDEKVNLSAEFSGLRGQEDPQTPELNPIVVKGKNFKAVLMPMRDASGKLPPGASQLDRRDISKPSMGPGAAAVAEFDEAPPDLEVMGLKTGSPFINEMNRRWRNLFAGFGQLTGRGKTKKDIALSINAMETIPNMVAQQAGNSFRLMLDDVRQQRAVTALMQSLKMSGEGLSQEDAARLGELQFAGDPQGYLRAKQTDMETLAQSQLSEGKRLEAQAAKEWAIALSDARTQFNQLRPVAQEAKRRLDRQLRREAAAGIETNYELWYVPQRYDFDLLPSANRPIVIGGQRGGSPSTSFRKAKYFEDYASAMEAGHIPRTFSIADLIEHRVRQGERLVARKAMFQGLKTMTDDLTGDPIAMNIPKRVIERPDGSVDVQEAIPRDYEPVDVIPGVRLAIHKGYARGIRAMTGTSQISESAIVSSLQNLAAVEKHLGLALDTFHLSRTLQTEFALTHRMSLPFTERTRRGAALVEYSTADLDRAVQKGEITQGIADWITKPQSFNVQGRDIQMSPKAVVNLGARNGLGIGRIADVIYKDWIRQTPVFGTINKLVFDKITRSAVAQGFISEFDRVSRQHPEWAGEKVAKTVASDINVLFGNLQKESWVKSPSLNALMQIAFLAPNWVQSLIRREARAVIQVGQAAAGVAKGEGFRIGSAGKAMGEGILMYLVGTQLLNLITRGHLTFQNEEEGHKLDAFIPDPFTPGKGFFISPFSVFGEITHDLIRYAQSKPDLATAITQIGANKFGNVGRAIAVTATGRDPIDNHKLIGTANRAMAAAYQLIPVPITLSGVGKEALGKSFPDFVTRPTTTQVGRQVASSLGFKVEPAPTAQTQITALVDRWKAGQEPAVASQVTRRLQEDFGPSNYRELRSALVNEQTDQATRAYRALRQEGKTPEQIRKIIEHPHPFAGSRALEARFVDSLSPQEQKLYERALDEREEIISRFEQMLDNRPQLTEEESQ